MARYKIKPIEIEAFQWSGWPQNSGDVKPYLSRDPYWICPECGGADMVHGVIEKLDGDQIVCPGDFVIRDSGQEMHACHPDQFISIYDPA